MIPTPGRPARRVEPGEQPAHLLQHLTAQLAPVEQRGERAPLVEAAHLHDVLDGAPLALRRQLQPVRGADERAHAEVDAGRQTAVQAHLLGAHLSPPGRSRVVQERERERLLQLVGALTRQEDPGDVRLAHRHLGGLQPRQLRHGRPDLFGLHRRAGRGAHVGAAVQGWGTRRWQSTPTWTRRSTPRVPLIRLRSPRGGYA